MTLQPDSKKTLISEFQFVVQKLNESIPFDEKLFFYSALHGTVNRLLNADPSPELVFLHHVLNTMYAAFNGRIQALKAGDPFVKIDENIMTKFIEYNAELQSHIEADLPLQEVYLKMISLAYVTTGNGYYLYARGKLQI